MPETTEHSAVLRDSKDFDPKTFRRKNGGTIYGRIKVPKTIGILWAKLKGKAKPSNMPIPQSLLFPIRIWTVAKAKKWLKTNKVKFILFEAAKPKKKEQAIADPDMERAQEEKRVYGYINDVTVRSVDEKTRTIEYVFATEGGVQTWRGIEYLRISGADLKRYKKNPVVLDSHNRYEVGAIVGRADVRKENRALVGSITYASGTVRAEDAWQLAKTDFLRTVSVSFIPVQAEIVELADGQTDGRDENTIVGPARVIKKWELCEISVVPVPADADAVRRSGSDDFLNFMTYLVKRAMEKEEGVMVEKKKDGDEQNVVPDPEVTLTEDEKRGMTPPVEEIAAESRTREIRAIAPRGMEKLADQCVVEGLSVEDARKRMLEAHAKGMEPVGTPEAPKIETKAKEGDEKVVEDMPDEEFARNITG